MEDRLDSPLNSNHADPQNRTSLLLRKVLFFHHFLLPLRNNILFTDALGLVRDIVDHWHHLFATSAGPLTCQRRAGS
jgi:hypothetical protein